MDEPELEGPKGFRSRFYVYQNVIQAAFAQLATPTVEWQVARFDTLTEVLLVNPWVFRPRRSGYYFLHSSLWITHIGAGFYGAVGLRVNGALNAQGFGYTNLGNSAAGQVSVIRHLEAGDLVDIYAYWNGGVPNAAAIMVGEGLSYFTGHRLS